MNRGLRQNMCRLTDPGISNIDIPDVDTWITPVLQYACKHWLTHLRLASKLDPTLEAELATFCNEHLLHWVEALSLLGSITSVWSGFSAVLKQLRVRMFILSILNLPESSLEE